MKYTIKSSRPKAGLKESVNTELKEGDEEQIYEDGTILEGEFSKWGCSYL